MHEYKNLAHKLPGPDRFRENTEKPLEFMVAQFLGIREFTSTMKTNEERVV